jgi:F420H(2)-dependent quinone reductase
VASYLDVAEKSWPVLRRAGGLHTLIYRLSGGWVGHRFLVGPPMLLLDHVGARSGKKRTTPLVYGKDGPNLVLVASKGGYPKNPGWFHNLMAHPDIEVQVGTERRKVHVRQATDDERTRLWPLMVRVWPGYDDYRKRTDRKIPLLVLEPR